MSKLPIFTAPQDAAEAEFHWFIYGSSLDFDALRAWCAEHGYVPPDVGRAEPARLPGWRLAFNVASKFWGGRVASLVEDAGSTVEGILVPMPASALGFVRHREGVLSGLYEERLVQAETFGGARHEVKVFVAAPSRVGPEGPPAERYVETLRKGARERGLSPAWIAQLDALSS